MARPVLTIADQDVSAYVVSWGRLEAFTKLRLSDSKLFTSRMTLPLDNSTGAFTPGGPASLLPATGWAGMAAVLTKDGVELFDGFVSNIAVALGDQRAELEFSTALTEAADTPVDMDESAINPAIAVLALLETAGLGDRLHRPSFTVAAGYFGTRTIAVSAPAADGETALSLASKIADVCSLSFTQVNGKVYAQVERPWQGEGLRQEINGTNAYELENLSSNAEGFANQVIFNYGAGLSVTLNDEASQRAERGHVIGVTVDATTDAKVQVSSAATARFLGDLILARRSPRRLELRALLGPDFQGVLPGHKHPVTAPQFNLSAAPFEVTSAQRNLDADTTTVTLEKKEIGS